MADTPSFHLYECPARGGLWLQDITDHVPDYGHAISNFGGWDSASMTVQVKAEQLDDWIENGLARQIYCEDGEGVFFRAFINSMSISVGGLQFSIGSVLELANRVSVRYSPINTTVWPYVTGTPTQTIIVEDAASQARYGIVEKIIDGGSCTDEAAEQIRDKYLAENAYPRKSINLAINLSGGDVATLQLELLGIFHWLAAYPYELNDATIRTIDEVVKLILSADPNGYFSADQSLIEANAQLVIGLIEIAPALDVLKGLLERGNDADDRILTFGIFSDDNRFVMRARSNVVGFEYWITDVHQKVITVLQEDVLPWRVTAGIWVSVPDFLVGLLDEDYTLRQNYRTGFADQVKFTMPWQVDITGGDVPTLPQLIAKIGYAGGVV